MYTWKDPVLFATEFEGTNEYTKIRSSLNKVEAVANNWKSWYEVSSRKNIWGSTMSPNSCISI